MVNQKKIETMKEMDDYFKNYSVIGILNIYKLPSRQLYQMKQKLKGKAKIKIAKKTLLERALKNSGKKGLEKLFEQMGTQPGLLFTNSNPFELARVIDASKSKTTAKPGDIATADIMVPAGPTSLPAGPAISEMTKAGIPAGVEGGKIVVKADKVIVKKGEVVKKEVADALAKLNIEPMEIGLDLTAVWDNGVVYTKDILFVPLEKYVEDVKTAYRNAFNLAYNAKYYTKDNGALFIAEAYKNALNLAVNSGIITKESLGHILAKAQAQAVALKKLVKE